MTSVGKIAGSILTSSGLTSVDRGNLAAERNALAFGCSSWSLMAVK
jgi:hypothetical protein